MPDRQRLKLLVITMMYEPDCVGIAAVASDMCAALAANGHDVTVYTTYPYYPEWKLKSDRIQWRVQKESIRDVHVRRHRIFVPANPSRLLPRLLHEISFPISLLGNLFRRERFDVVMVFCPLMGSVIFASLRKLFSREPLWINIQDIPVEAAAASGIMRSGLLARLAATVQKFLFNRGDVLSSISPDMVRRLKSFKRADLPVHLCPNWLTGSLGEQIRQFSCKVGRTPQSTPRLLYSGTIGKKQGLLQFCQSLSKSDDDFQFQIRGEGSEAAAVQSWVASSGDRRFVYGSLLPQTQFINAMHDADWFVIPQKSSAGSSFFPSKLIPSISVGTPILAVSESDCPLSHEVVENGIGLVVPWSQVECLVKVLGDFRTAPNRYQELQENCVQRAKAFDREVAINKFESLLHAIADHHAVQAEKSLFQRRLNGRVPTP